LKDEAALPSGDRADDPFDPDETGRSVGERGLQEAGRSVADDVTGEGFGDLDLTQARATVSGSSYTVGS
jgi:hypothetical protein